MEQFRNIRILPDGRVLTASDGDNLLEILRRHGLGPEAPCGGHGSCGKCKVFVDGTQRLACGVTVTKDMTVSLPDPKASPSILTEGIDAAEKADPVREGLLLAFDIGTTTLVGYLLDGTGTALAASGMLNPQRSYGADVVTRIQAALAGDMPRLTAAVRQALDALTRKLCGEAGRGPEEIGTVCVVGNPCMQQLFLGISPENLVQIPFSPVLTHAQITEAGDTLPLWGGAALLTVPDISGYIGADTLACVMATKLYDAADWTLMVDIGTNGEMVLGSRHRMIACSTAAGPALEGANIRFGMCGVAGAIDHVWPENGRLSCSVIGGGKASGICGSGLIDAVACALELGTLNARGRILTTEERDGTRILPLTEEVYLTQEDIREVQLAKGAIAAGIHLMARTLGIELSQIRRVLLAGAFGSYMDPANACRIGLLPRALAGKVRAVGNAAGSGARQMACSKEAFRQSERVLKRIEFLELGSLPDFQREFAKQMRFEER